MSVCPCRVQCPCQCPCFIVLPLLFVILHLCVSQKLVNVERLPPTSSRVNHPLASTLNSTRNGERHYGCRKGNLLGRVSYHAFTSGVDDLRPLTSRWKGSLALSRLNGISSYKSSRWQCHLHHHVTDRARCRSGTGAFSRTGRSDVRSTSGLIMDNLRVFVISIMEFHLQSP